MNDRMDERKVSKYLYELSGRAGTICVSAQPHEPGTQPNLERLAGIMVPNIRAMS